MLTLPGRVPSTKPDGLSLCCTGGLHLAACMLCPTHKDSGRQKLEITDKLLQNCSIEFCSQPCHSMSFYSHWFNEKEFCGAHLESAAGLHKYHPASIDWFWFWSCMYHMDCMDIFDSPMFPLWTREEKPAISVWVQVCIYWCNRKFTSHKKHWTANVLWLGGRGTVQETTSSGHLYIVWTLQDAQRTNLRFRKSWHEDVANVWPKAFKASGSLLAWRSWCKGSCVFFIREAQPSWFEFVWNIGECQSRV